MARRRKPEVLPERKDKKKRTERQVDTMVNGRNWLARKYYDKRAEHKAELLRLRRDNRDFARMYFDLKARFDRLEAELKSAKSK